MSDPDIKLVEEIRKKVNEIKSSSSSSSSSKSNSSSSEPVGGVNTPEWKADSSELREYLNNLYTEYTFQCMSERLPDGCHRLANYLENIRNQYREATELYKKTCDEMKYPRSCLVYARNRSLGRGCKQDLADACRYNLLCCEKYDLNEGCLNAGICASEGVGQTPVDVARGCTFLDRACQKGNAVACVRLFKIYIDGMGNVRRDPNRALGYTVMACDQGDMIGCMNASMMHRKGDGIPKDAKKAEEFYDRADALRREVDSFRDRPGVVFGEQHR